MSKVRRTACAVVISLLLSACATVGDKALSKSAAEITGQKVAWQSLAKSASERVDVEKGQINASKLTDLVDVTADEHLSAFITEALESNPSLQQTLVTLRKAQVAIDSAEAQDNLNVDASLSGSRTEQTGNSFSSSLSVSWELDLWQRIADGVTAANLDAASAKASYQAARDSLVASVIRNYIEVITQQHLLFIERERLHFNIQASEYDVDVADVVKGLTDDLKYLLQGKFVTLSLHLTPCSLTLPDTAAQIVIGNIIRNAFQHTYQGEVNIQLDSNTLVVSNREHASQEDSPSVNKFSGGEAGFGIGLKLIEKLSRKLNWGYRPAFTENGYSVTLDIRSLTHE